MEVQGYGGRCRKLLIRRGLVFKFKDREAAVERASEYVDHGATAEAKAGPCEYTKRGQVVQRM